MVLVVAAAVLVPLAIAPGLLLSYDVTPKVAILLAGAALALPWRRAGREALAVLMRTVPGKWLGLLSVLSALWLAVSTAASADPAISLTGSGWRRLGLVSHLALLAWTLMAAAQLHRRSGGVLSLLRWTAAAGLAVAVYGIAQYFGADPLLSPESYHVGEGERRIVRPPATFGYVTYAATYYLHVAFSGLALWRCDRARWWRILGTIAGTAAVAAIVLSGTRAALLGLLAGGGLLAWRDRPRSWRRVAAMLAVAFALFAALLISPVGQKLRARLVWAWEEPAGGARRWLWADSLRMGLARPWTGWGPETFLAEFPQFQSLELARAYPDFHHESPHNIFLDALTECGFPGLLLLAAFCALGSWCAGRGRERSSLAAILGATLAASVVSQQFSVFTAPTALYFFLTVAALVALAAEPAARKPLRHDVAAVVPAVLLAGGFLFCAIRLAVSDFHLGQTKRLLNAGRIQEAMAAYERGRRWQLPGVTADLWYSRALAEAAGRTGDLAVRLEAARRALEAARRAPAHTEDPANAFYNLAAFSAATNDSEATIAHLRRAIQSAPQWFKPHWMLAQVLALAGRWEEAEAEAARAAELDGGKHPEVRATLEQIRARRLSAPL